MSAIMGNLDRFRPAKPVAAPQKAAPQPKAGKAPNGDGAKPRSASGRFVSQKAQPKAVAAAPQGKAVGTIDLYLSEVKQGGKDGTGARLKGEVLSLEGSGHRIRVLVYTDTASEMEAVLDRLVTA